MTTPVPDEAMCGRPTGEQSRPFCTRTTGGRPCKKHRSRREHHQPRKANRAAYKAQLAALDGTPACHGWEPLPRPYPEPSGRLTRAEFVLMAWQKDRCAICGVLDVGWLMLDHDHDTDAIRGYLCPRCNAYDVWAFGDAEGAAIFEAYRKRPPAAMLGLRARYGNPVGDDGYWPDGNKGVRWFRLRVIDEAYDWS